MKLLAFIKQNTKTILAVAVVVLLILLFVKPCNKQAAEVVQLKAENKVIRSELKQKEDTIKLILAKHRRDSAEWKGKEQLADIEQQEADKKVKQQQSTIDRLITVIRTNTGKPVDSSFVLVSPAFKEACEDMPRAIAELNKVIAEKDTAISEWTDILAYEVQQRDSTIDALSIQVNKVMELNQRQNKIVEDALRAAKPRGRLLGGVGLIGNETQLLAGTKINLAYQSKGGKQYQVGGLLLRGAVYYEVGVMITLIK